MRLLVFFTPLIVFLSVLLYGIVHSLLATKSFKSLVRRLFGSYTDRWYRLAYNIFAIISLLPVLALPALLPDHTIYVVTDPWIYLTFLGQVLAVGLLLVGFLQTGVWTFLGFRQLVTGGEHHETRMVVRGLYRFVRHPLYTAGLVFIWLTPVMTKNIFALNLGLSIYIVFGAYLEERRLEKEYGAVYRAYKKSTPMLVPFLGSRAERDETALE
ncbi:MAG: isoprenylcysteine carboxylmethyltransferase family protein [Anaerolineales bacterium]|nr:isoprenylcysteine carboxylmethyltransferase family protein [Anaerolineales bacterium]